MGAKFSKQQPKKGDSSDSRSSSGTSIIELIKPECLKPNKNKKKKIEKDGIKKRQLQHPGKRVTKAKNVTLEDWLTASPGPDIRPDCLNGGELYVFKQSSKRVHPSATKLHQTKYSTPRSSFRSSDASSVDGSLSRSQSGKLKKRVSFKLPDEDDIILFYSPEDSVMPTSATKEE